MKHGENFPYWLKRAFGPSAARACGLRPVPRSRNKKGAPTQ